MDPRPPTSFAFKPHELASLLDPKSLGALTALGGTQKLLVDLGTDPTTGLALVHTFHADLDERRKVYGQNILPQRPRKTLLRLMWSGFKDNLFITISPSLAAVVLLVLGLFQNFGTTPENKPVVAWVEAVAIVIVILIIITMGFLIDWQQEQHFRALDETIAERGVKVIRDGAEQVVDTKEVVVGDIALLEPGDFAPCDGVFLSGHNVKCNESGVTGDSAVIEKASYEECLAMMEEGASIGGVEALRDAGHTDCFIVSGSKVLEGTGRYVVVAVGPNSFEGRITMALRGNAECTPLQLKLIRIASTIARIGKAAGGILFMILMIRYFVQLGKGTPKRTPIENGTAFSHIVMISLALIMIAMPDSIPRAFLLALAFTVTRMAHDKILVRGLSSCETMANATVICTDETSILMRDGMSVIAGSIGIHAKFVRNLAENKVRTNADELYGSIPSTPQAQVGPDAFPLDQGQLDTVLSPQLRILLNDAICVGSTAFNDCCPETGETVFVGDQTETALLKFARELRWPDYMETMETADVVRSIPFSSESKAIGVVVKLPSGNHRLYLKGPSEIWTTKCTSHVLIASKDTKNSAGMDEEIETLEIDVPAMDNIRRTNRLYANQGLHTVALCYRDFKPCVTRNALLSAGDEVPYVLCTDLVLIGVVAIEHPLRPGVRDVVETCRRAGVSVKMCTGENRFIARSIAVQAGIYSTGGIVMQGPAFRILDQQQKLEVVPNLQVLAWSSPQDKKVFVEKLKELGEMVATTGGGSDDAVSTLKTTNVGISIGIGTTEVTNEASDIILMDDNFASVIKAILGGRCPQDFVRKILQFRMSTQLTVVIVTLVSAFVSFEEASVLSPVQLLWIVIMMDIFVTFAFATDPPSEKLLDYKPDRGASPLISVDMYKQIFFQSIYQIIFTLTLHFTGQQILGFPALDPNTQEHNRAIVRTLVFNSLVFSLIFNSINCRRSDNKLNVFEGITRNPVLLIVISIEIIAQILIVLFGRPAFRVVPIGGWGWGISLVLGVTSIPLGALLRLLPSPPFENLFISMCLLPMPEVLPMARRTTRTCLNPWGCSSVEQACDSITSIPRDVCPPTSNRSRIGTIIGMGIAILGIVFTAVQTFYHPPKTGLK